MAPAVILADWSSNPSIVNFLGLLSISLAIATYVLIRSEAPVLAILACGAAAVGALAGAGTLADEDRTVPDALVRLKEGDRVEVTTTVKPLWEMPPACTDAMTYGDSLTGLLRRYFNASAQSVADRSRFDVTAMSKSLSEMEGLSTLIKMRVPDYVQARDGCIAAPDAPASCRQYIELQNDVVYTGSQILQLALDIRTAVNDTTKLTVASAAIDRLASHMETITPPFLAAREACGLAK